MSELADQATPHSDEPMMKRPMDIIHIGLAPNRSTAHPVTGITTASERR